MPMDGNILRRLDAEIYLVATNVDHLDRDVVADVDFFELLP